jgi:hypothetical protein
MDLSKFYPLLTLISIVLFVWLGRRMALDRNRNGLAWGIGGALLPPVLLVLLMLRPLPPAETAEGEAGEWDEA